MSGVITFERRIAVSKSPASDKENECGSMTRYFDAFGITFLFCIINLCFGLRDSDAEVNFYVVSRREALHYEKVTGFLSDTLGFCKDCDSTVVLLHGLGSSYDSDCNEKIAEGLLVRKTINIIAAGYSTAVEGPGYDSAAKNSDSIGNAVGVFLLASQNDGSISLATTTLIGFSLGAHVAGVAGYRIRESSGYLKRIIGLDPARPAFMNRPLESRLDRSDAGYVMVIHTAAGFLGTEEALGHADFYPNGGREIQPRCLGNRLHSLVCSHAAACEYLADSISRSSFIAEKCQSWEDYQRGNCRNHEKAFMGFDTDSTSEGIFFLKTDLRSSMGTSDEETFEVVDVNTLSETDGDRILSQYHWYPRSVASLFSPSTVLFSMCAVALQTWIT